LQLVYQKPFDLSNVNKVKHGSDAQNTRDTLFDDEINESGTWEKWQDLACGGNANDLYMSVCDAGQEALKDMGAIIPKRARRGRQPSQKWQRRTGRQATDTSGSSTIKARSLLRLQFRLAELRL